MEVNMKKRDFGEKSDQVSEIGLGTWQLGNNDSWHGPSVEESIRIIERAYNKGCNFFDTAPNYGAGNSEKVLGRAISALDIREHVYINSKFGHWPNGEEDFDSEKIEVSVDSSLKRLKTNYLDSLILHNPTQEILEGKTDHFEKLVELKANKKIRNYGVSVDSSQEMITVMNHTDVQIIEVMFNLLYQEPKKAFQKAKEKGISIIVKVPLDSGWLTGKYDENSEFSDIRDRWTAEDKKLRSHLIHQIKNIVGTDDLIHQALKFILSFPQVTTIIPGAKNIHQLEHNLEASGEVLSSERKEKFEELYDVYIKKEKYSW
jgi:aryl-alcohol dehydrogenase-like predicted oxidoreductase